MTGPRFSWRVRLTAAAEADFQDIMRWTMHQLGETQARAYAQTLSAALASLGEGPAVMGARSREDIAKGLFTLHVARQGRRGRHFILFRTARDADQQVIEALRILHDVMDLARHVSADQD